MGFFRRFFFHSPKRYALAAAVGLALVLLYLFLHGFQLLFYYVDAFSISGSVLILLGLLGAVAYFGAFDTVGYAFQSFAAERRYKDLYEYARAKKEKRKRGELGFMALVNVGLLFLAVGVLLRLRLHP